MPGGFSDPSPTLCTSTRTNMTNCILLSVQIARDTSNPTQSNISVCVRQLARRPIKRNSVPGTAVTLSSRIASSMWNKKTATETTECMRIIGSRLLELGAISLPSRHFLSLPPSPFLLLLSCFFSLIPSFPSASLALFYSFPYPSSSSPFPPLSPPINPARVSGTAL